MWTINITYTHINIYIFGVVFGEAYRDRRPHLVPKCFTRLVLGQDQRESGVRGSVLIFHEVPNSTT